MPLTRSADGRPSSGEPGTPPPNHAASRRDIDVGESAVDTRPAAPLLPLLTKAALAIALVVVGLLLPGGVLVFVLATITCVAALAHGALSDADPDDVVPSERSESFRSIVRSVRYHLDL